ncbi:Manganese-binding lipoprotein MntA [Polaromonas vacuolata]|uniref:Manganese-binding lipoprotein MntA n=1 Tax=Polaromonas vacuolata TaxID=37448 RepID=A0A6H2H7E7_9BURK|nr:metal ABC transporter substrate-binding protein [Polaromonas vacuolata]QJC55687.1 Manganese-binding lipoprotein MntA [Polaromonas vacuolata]
MKNPLSPSRQTWLALALCLASASSMAQEKLPVVASFSILGDLVRVVGGDRVSVHNLVGPDEDAHVFEPKPSDAKTLLAAKLLVSNGLDFEPWLGKLSVAAGYKGQSVVASQGVKWRSMAAEPANVEPNHASKEKADHAGHEDHAGKDPHAWQDPQNVILYVNNIAKALAKIDPAGAIVYQKNSAAYVAELQSLDAWGQQQFTAIASDKRKVITSHDAFGYFAAHYKIRFLAPQGMSTGTEPSAKQVAQLIRQIQREKIRAVFLENMSNTKLLTQLSKDAGVKVGPVLYVDALSAPSGPAPDYLRMMRYNITELARGLALN